MKAKFDKNGYQATPKHIAKAIRESIIIHDDKEAFGDAVSYDAMPNDEITIRIKMSSVNGTRITPKVSFEGSPLQRKSRFVTGLRQVVNAYAKAVMI